MGLRRWCGIDEAHEQTDLCRYRRAITQRRREAPGPGGRLGGFGKWSDAIQRAHVGGHTIDTHDELDDAVVIARSSLGILGGQLHQRTGWDHDGSCLGGWRDGGRCFDRGSARLSGGVSHVEAENAERARQDHPQY